MAGDVGQIRLRETDSEYLAFVPYHQKERAKLIPGYRWDSVRKCWTYARNPQAYRDLLAEFQDADVRISPPQMEDSQPASDAEGSGDQPNVASELAEIRAILEVYVAGQGDERVLRLGEMLRQRDEELDAAKRTQYRLEAERDHARQRLNEASEDVGRLMEQIDDLSNTLQKRDAELTVLRRRTQEAEAKASKAVKAQTAAEALAGQLTRVTERSGFEADAKRVALKASSMDSRFRGLLEVMPLDKVFPVELLKALTDDLGYLLGPASRGSDVPELLTRARDRGLLTAEAIDLAHVIRKQRNILSHKGVHPDTCDARTLMCLYAGALLWPEFPERS